MSQNALSRKVNGNGKVILDTHPESDQHQNWTCSRGSPPAATHQIWWWSMNPFLRYLADKNSAHRQTDRHTDTRRWPQDLAAYGAQVTTYVYESSMSTVFTSEITQLSAMSKSTEWTKIHGVDWQAVSTISCHCNCLIYRRAAKEVPAPL